MHFRSLTSLAAAAWLLAGSASAQVQTISTESFDYPYPGLLINANGGSGWAQPWDVVPNGNEIVIFQNGPQHPPFGGDDGIGNFAGQGNEWGEAFRQVSTAGHSDVTEGGKFGKDGAVLWFTFNTRTYQQFGDHFGGFSLFDGSNEVLFIGSPWASYGWGLDDGSGGVIIPGSDDSLDARLVCRVDYLAGMERARLWLNPGTDYPSNTADLDIMIPDQRFDTIRLTSGGSASHQYWDGIRIEKGDPGPGGDPIGSNYCGPANKNSSGQSAVISAFGSDVAADNDVLLMATEMPQNQFGYFLNSMTPGFVANPGGSQGNLCLSGEIGRYSKSIKNSGPTGEFSLQLDLTQTPTPSGPVSVMAGETWFFQCWFRDKNPSQTSNFTDGIRISFL